MSVRVRFAPSPTGHLHIGTARTALFNWLFARKEQGTFILRIEDTDLERSKKEFESSIINDLRWLGIDWDEFYRQSDRLNIYREIAEQLLSEGKAYECFCTKEELEKLRGKGYNRRCLNLSTAEKEALRRERRPAIRLYVPKDGETRFNDYLHGELCFQNNVIDDFVILKSDGTPTYNFSVVVDDIYMKITHIIRGEDHISNTPKQIHIYNALGIEPPVFVHIPMILGQDKAKLSKRHGATSIGEYRSMGYLSEAMVNFLALMGASYNDKQVLSLEELIDLFSLDNLSKNPAIFDIKKLDFLSQEHIRRKSIEELTQLTVQFLREKRLEYWTIDNTYLTKVIGLLQTRIKTLKDIILMGDYFFTEDFSKDAEIPLDEKKRLSSILPELIDILNSIEDWSSTNLEDRIRSFITEKALDSRWFLQTLRIIISGKKVTPSLFETLEVLGKEKVVNRIKKGMN
ncbi:glutamate--tRNA ligase [bacterium]|nr:glutamate--tRNA ligase [bacterium]